MNNNILYPRQHSNWGQYRHNRLGQKSEHSPNIVPMQVKYCLGYITFYSKVMVKIFEKNFDQSTNFSQVSDQNRNQLHI